MKYRVLPWLEGIALALLVLALVAAGGDVLRASYHGLLHVRVGQAVLDAGLTPENPYHAGAPLRYYTLYPALGVLLGRAGCGPLWGFALLNVLAALLFPPALDALGRALGLAPRARRWAFWAAVLGFNALGWVGFVLGAAGAPAGAAPVMRLAPLTFAGLPWGWDQRLQAFLPKFLNVSSFALALPFALWALAAAGRDTDGKRAWPRVQAALAAAAALALNPLVGAWAGAVMAVWLLPLARQRPLRAFFAWVVAGAAAVALALPFLLPAFAAAPAGGPRVEVTLGSQPLADLLGPLAGLLVLAWCGRAAFGAGRAWRWGLAAAAAAALVVAGEMPWGNEYKMARLAGVLLALPAGAGLAVLGARRSWLPWTALLFALPTTLLVPPAYLAWARESPPLPLAWDGRRLVPRPGAEPRLPLELLEAEAAAPAGAVLLVDPFRFAAQLGGDRVQGMPLAPLFRHPLAVDLLQVHNEGQPDLGARLAAARALYLTDAAAPGLAALADLRQRFPGRPLLVLARAGEVADRAAAASGGEILVAASDFTLWWLPPPS